MLASRRLAVVCLALVALFSLPVHAGPLGAPFKVNIYDVGNQAPGDLTAGANGDVIVTWIDQARGSFTFMQRYDWQGTALQPDDWFLGSQYHQAAVDGEGWYVVLRTGPDGSGLGVYATIRDRQGNAVAPEFRVHATTAGDQINGVVAMNKSGQIAIAWTSYASGTPAVYARRFNFNGVALSPETHVGSSGAGQQATQSIAIDAAGNFVVTWYHFAPPTPPDIWARRFNSAGAPLGFTWRVNTYTASTQDHGRVAMNSQGDFIVTWQSFGQVPGSLDAFGQRYAANGAAIGGEFRINDVTAGDQYFPEVGLMDDGSFVVAWTDYGTPLPRVMARQFRPDGTPLASEAEVNTPGANAGASRLALDPAGRFTIIWQQVDPVTSTADVFARRYVMDTLPPVTTLSDGVAVNNITAATGSWTHYKIVVPPTNSTLVVDMNGAGMPGDANVYVRYAGIPTLTAWDFRPALPGNTEQFQINNIPPGEWYISIYAQTGYSGVNLTADYAP